MCGIAGFHSSPTLTRADVERMTDALAHRGPDGSGLYVAPGGRTALGHRRLAILDTSPLGHQPMTYGESGLWGVFNGEIYNFLELRRELAGKGYAFRSESDTEVVLAAYLAWGDEAFRRFNGMWAVALYDERQRTLLLCRDRYGVKPLYYRIDGAQVLFASELKAFWALGDRAGAAWDRRALRTAIENPFDLEASGQTLLEGVKNLPPGHLLRATSQGARTSCWWRTVDELVPVPGTLPEQAARFRELFFDACRLRMRSDVPIGTALSGGLDSSSVVATLAAVAAGGAGERSARSWRRAFVHAFPGTPLDETRYARLVADAAGVEMVVVQADEARLAGEVDAIVRAFESVYAGMPDAVYRVYREQRRSGIVVTLDGHGADELLGGYGWHVEQAMADAPLLSGRFRELMRQHRELLGAYPPGPWRTLVSSLARRPAIRALARATGVARAVRRSRPHPFLSRDALALAPYAPARAELPETWKGLDAVLYQDFHHLVLPRILKNFDLMSMAHGVEVRMPFMDHRLVTYAFSLPVESKLGGGFTKLVLREAMQGLLPDEVRLRKSKIGFNSPLIEWLQGPLRGWTEDTLDVASPHGDLVDVRKLRAVWNDYVRRGTLGWNEAVRFWTALNALRLTRVMGTRAIPAQGSAVTA